MTDLFERLSVAYERVAAALLEPVQLFQDPSKRVFWVYLLIGLIIAVLVFAMRYRGRWFRNFIGSFYRREFGFIRHRYSIINWCF